MRVLLISIDGMRPDAIKDLPQVKKIMQESSYSFNAKTVFPSVTLPCHVSMFHSVTPERHGTTTNVYAPQVRPVLGLVEALDMARLKSAFFYSWEQLRDLTRPGALSYSYFVAGKDFTYPVATETLLDDAIFHIAETDTDFVFFYIATPDEVGHAKGWMGEEYMDALNTSWNMVERIISTLPDDFAVIVTADHGGHDRSHGLDIPEDMTIPFFIKGKDIPKNTVLKDVSILDVAPTITKLLGVSPDRDWEGKSLI
jgi:predicted AlkP superfamily pyrophosphatase or phosphodiesterase